MMSIFKCKMCGGTIEFEKGATVGLCEYCGTKQTLPRLDDERRANLYDRANHFRRANEFDKAANIYEQILNEDTTDAEAYWSLVLCHYGIEYVEDPATHMRVPTVNRAQFTSIFDDDNYKSAIAHADGYQKTIYEEEAATINEIQKGILAISQKEAPFDVFICYKETDVNGRRTQDSVLANDLYHQLTQEGFKVFFSRITLEDKLGSAYEPYIFAALNSAKVMVVLGTRPEHFNAVWVKNEWSRYLAIVRQSGGKKMLIPAYKDMDPYDLPEEFSHLQAQDMSKLGFMQDLIRGIKKGLFVDESKTAVKETPATASAASLLKRAFIFLEDGEWAKADDYCEQVLNLDPENAQAYLGKLMAEQRVVIQAALADCAEPFDDSNNFQKAVRFGDAALSDTLNSNITHIKNRNENARLTKIYEDAEQVMLSAVNEAAFKKAAMMFQSIRDFRNADEQAQVCIARAEECHKKSKKAIAITVPIVAACVAFVAILITVIIPKQKQNKAMALLETGDYETAYALLEEIGDTDAIASNKYDRAAALIDAGDYETAYILLDGLDYKDSAAKLNSIKPQYHSILLSKAQVDSHVFFGTYEQDDDTSNGKEDIEWLVLAKEEDRVLVISQYALDCQKYNSMYASVTWETCSLRSWLNDEFLNAAFSVEEQNQIVSAMVTADQNPNYNTSAGKNTTDKVFLLSVTEATKYFTTTSKRQCSATVYAKERGAYMYDSNNNCWWWLRTTGYRDNYVANVYPDGDVHSHGDYVGNDGEAVRPAMWIKLPN